VVAPDDDLANGAVALRRFRDRAVPGADERVLHTESREALQQIQNLPRAAIQMSPGFDMEDFHDSR
jgi:hypothetical protein